MRDNRARPVAGAVHEMPRTSRKQRVNGQRAECTYTFESPFGPVRFGGYTKALARQDYERWLNARMIASVDPTLPLSVGTRSEANRLKAVTAYEKDRQATANRAALRAALLAKYGR